MQWVMNYVIPEHLVVRVVQMDNTNSCSELGSVLQVENTNSCSDRGGFP